MNVIARLRTLIQRPEGKIGKYIVTERVITFLTRIVDALMIYFIWTIPDYGVVYAFVVGGIVYFVLCASVIYINDVFLRNGYDITGIEELRQMAHRSYPQKNWVKRLVSWMLKRKTTIFLVGSWFYLDPDYVTLLLRDKDKGLVASLTKITLPSVIISMAVWTPIYWCACKGYTWAVWLIS